MSQQVLAVVVDTPDDEATAVESAAAAAVESLQSAGVLVISATFGGASLLPTPAEALRSAVEALTELAKGSPAKSALQAAIERVDQAAAVVEAATPAAPPAGPGSAGNVALPDEPPAPAVLVPDLSAASSAG